MSTNRNFRNHRININSAWALAVACVVGLGVMVDTASAQSGSTRRRGGGGSDGAPTGTPSGTTTPSGTSTPAVTGENYYLPSELDKPIDEFFIGQTAYPQPQGNIQMTLGGGVGMANGAMQLNQLRARGEYGITNQLEVHAELPVSFTEQNGSTSLQPQFDRVGVGALYNVAPMNDPIALSAAFDVDLPIGSATSTGTSSGVSSETYFKPSLIAAYDFGATEVHSDLQAVLGGAARGLNFNVGAAHSLGAWVPTLELNSRALENARPEMYVTPGLYYNFSNRVELGVGVPVGLNDRSATSVMAKLNVQLGR